MTVKELLESYVGYPNCKVSYNDNECSCGLILASHCANKKVKMWGFTEDHMLGIVTAD